MRQSVLLTTIAALAAGCGDPAAPPRPPVVAAADIVVLSLPSPRNDPGYHAICQTGAVVSLRAGDSHDPAGQSLTYEWTDTVGGYPTTNFGPESTIRTTDPEIEVVLSTIDVHEILLTVSAADGRKARTSVRVLVTGCDC
jgi:hypothetical protein